MGITIHYRYENMTEEVRAVYDPDDRDRRRSGNCHLGFVFPAYARIVMTR